MGSSFWSYARTPELSLCPKGERNEIYRFFVSEKKKHDDGKPSLIASLLNTRNEIERAAFVIMKYWLFSDILLAPFLGGITSIVVFAFFGDAHSEDFRLELWRRAFLKTKALPILFFLQSSVYGSHHLAVWGRHFFGKKKTPKTPIDFLLFFSLEVA